MLQYQLKIDSVLAYNVLITAYYTLVSAQSDLMCCSILPVTIPRATPGHSPKFGAGPQTLHLKPSVRTRIRIESPRTVSPETKSPSKVQMGQNPLGQNPLGQNPPRQNPLQISNGTKCPWTKSSNTSVRHLFEYAFNMLFRNDFMY